MRVSFARSRRARRARQQGLRRAGQRCFKSNSTTIVRTMFVLYTLLILGGIIAFVIVGFTQG